MPRWLFAATLCAAAPKCVLCVLAYASLALGLGSTELCGASPASQGISTPQLAWLGAVTGGGAFACFAFCSRDRCRRRSARRA